MQRRLRLGLVLTIGAALPAAAVAQAPVHYDLSFDNAVHHEARITVTYRDVGARPLRFQMSRSSPGRYAIHEFAKNVYSVSARDGSGRRLTVSRTDPYSWIVTPGADRTVSVSYTLYADRGDGTYSQIDPTHAHLNMPATLMWASGFQSRPVTIKFKPADPTWKVATQLMPGATAFDFSAPNFQYLMDSPAELSNFELREWQVPGPGGDRRIRLAVHHQGTSAQVDTLAAKAKKVVAQQIALFGSPAPYDAGTYTFIVDALPHVAWDGMEHRNSTVITASEALAATNYAPQLGTISHEFFHSWNVERLRPRELEPFDFTRANPTPLLWFAEGFTTYYAPLFIHRAGEATVDQLLDDFSGIWSGVLNSPGRAFGSPEEMSLRAPFLDAAVAIDPATSNTVTNYYPYGAAIGLALDLILRQRGHSLDAFMRHMWHRNGVAEKPFSTADLESGLAELTRDPRFARSFFDAYIRRSGLPYLAPLVAQAGLTLRQKSPAKPWAGRAPLKVAGKEVTLSDDTRPGSPLYLAGVARGDEILSIQGKAIDSQSDWDQALAAARVGQSVEIRFVQRGRERRSPMTLQADPAVEIVRNETIGKTVTPAQRAFRDSWLGAAGPVRS